MMVGLLSRFPAVRVLVLGDAILDEYLSGECSRLSPEAPVPVVRVSGVRQVLGGAANTAANVASLGGHPQLVALTGQDAAGEALAGRCREFGIELVPIVDGRPIQRKMRVVGQHQQLVRLDYEDSRAIDPAIEAKVKTLVLEHLPTSDIVVISDYAKGLLTSRLCQEVIEGAHRCGKQVVVDPRPQHRESYRRCDYLTPNWKEAVGLLGQSDEELTDQRIQQTGSALAEAFHTNLLLTLGSRGMAFFGREGGERFSVPTVAREVFDVSGAGDTVVAAFALARAAGAGHLEAVTLANKAAGVVVGKFGTATVAPAELSELDHESGNVVSRQDLASLVAALRATAKRIVTINGAFDLMHAGHLHILREASQQADVLIVGLNSDASVKSHKGPNRPIVPEEQRAAMLLALRFVDYVHIFDEPVPLPFIEAVRPDVHVNGSEYGEDCIEAPTVRAHGGRIHLVGRIAGISTTTIIETLSGAR